MRRFRGLAVAAIAALTLAAGPFTGTAAASVPEGSCTGWTSGNYHYYLCNWGDRHELAVWNGDYIHIYHW